MKECMTKFISKDWTKEEKILFGSTALLLGLVIGFVISPVKKGIGLFSNNGNSNGNNNSSTNGIECDECETTENEE